MSAGGARRKLGGQALVARRTHADGAAALTQNAQVAGALQASETWCAAQPRQGCGRAAGLRDEARRGGGRHERAGRRDRAGTERRGAEQQDRGAYGEARRLIGVALARLRVDLESSRRDAIEPARARPSTRSLR